ncbi:hypothetical protein V2J09_011806 [Rumex salicifolius]
MISDKIENRAKSYRWSTYVTYHRWSSYTTNSQNIFNSSTQKIDERGDEGGEREEEEEWARR